MPKRTMGALCAVALLCALSGCPQLAGVGGDGNPNTGSPADLSIRSGPRPTPEPPDILWETPGYSPTFDSATAALVSAPRGNLLALPEPDGVQLWRHDDDRPGPHLTGLMDIPTCIAFTPDETMLAAVDPNGLLNLWRVADGVLLWSRAHEHQQAASALVFSADSRTLATVGDGTLHLRRVSDGGLLRTLSDSDGSGVVAFAPDGETIAWASEQEVNIWSVAAGTVQQTLATPAIALRFAADGQTLSAVTREPASLAVWDLTNGQLQGSTSLAGDPEIDAGDVAVFSPDGATLSALSYSLFTWRTSDGTVVSQINMGHFDAPGHFWNVAYVSDGQELVTYGNLGVYFWRTTDGESLGKLPTHYSAIGAVAFSPDGQTLVSAGGGDGPDFNSGVPSVRYFDTPREWQADDGTPLRVFSRRGQIGSLRFSPDGQYLVIGGAYCTCGVTAVRLADEKVVCVLPVAPVVGMGFAPDGRSLLIASRSVWLKCCSGQAGLTIWAIPEATELYTLVNDFEYFATAAVLAPDGAHVAVREEELLLRQTSDGAVVWSQSVDETPIGFDADGRMLITKSGNSLWFRRMTDGEHLGNVEDDSQFIATACSSDYRLLASCHDDGTIKVWRTGDGALLRIYTDTAARRVAFSPDSGRIAWGCGDGSLVVARIPENLSGQ